MMKKILFAVIVAVLFAGCQSPITDVGNPNESALAPATDAQNAPSMQQLVGNYGDPGLASASGPAEPADADALPSYPDCQSDPKATKSIAIASKANQIILTNFMNYSTSTKQITATYEDGDLFFGVVDSKVDIECDGTATFSGSSIVINLTCDLIKPTKTTCSIFYMKQ